MRCGLWCPDVHTDLDVYVARADALMEAVRYAKGKDVVVQAGGHIGIVPALLAKHFRAVYTFEPEHENFTCLVRNTEGLPHVYAARGAVDDVRVTVGLALHSKNSGGHSVKGMGPIPAYRIDDMGLPACDAIFLDIEGNEMHALRGALDTIDDYHPLLVVEENKKCHGKGFHFGDIEKMLAPFGYRVTDRIGEDLVLQCD